MEAFALSLARTAIGEDVSLSDLVYHSNRFGLSHDELVEALRFGLGAGWLMLIDVTGTCVSNSHEEIEETLSSMAALLDRADDDGMVFDFHVRNTQAGEDRGRVLRMEELDGYDWAQGYHNWTYKFPTWH